ncbi:MAG: hypothetical protein AMJ62_01225 [Myxococcales bacterium SG8_38]|nr:MAG: hypothetical protein AMJ62_01225 [Myxococcales bacterium SG8_38]
MNLDAGANQFGAWLAKVKQGFVDALPNLATAAVIIALGWALAWALRKIIRRVLRRLGTQAPPADLGWGEAADYRGAGDVAANAAYWLTLLTTLMIAIDALGLPVFGKWIGAFASYLPRLVIALGLLLGGIVAGRIARNAVTKAAARMPVSQARSLARLTQTAIVIVTILVAADELGLDVSSLTAVFLIALAAILGGGALAFGLGAREVMSDILAMHYVNKYYRIGQVVRIGSDQGRIIRTSRTAVFLESPEGELSIPGRQFNEHRCVLVSREEDRGA